ncbi:MAG: AAA family ATPase [Candidatus Hodarchaeales archaeon]|jgi:adenylate kinase
MDDTSPLRVYITGVPATGKTTIAKKLSDLLSLQYLEINSVVLEKGLFFGYDINRESVIIDEELLLKELNLNLRKINRICLVGPMISLDKVFNMIVVLRCGIKVLRERLSVRNYSMAKIEENVEAEIMNIIYYDSINIYGEEFVTEVFTDQLSVEEACNEIISIISQHHTSIL